MPLDDTPGTPDDMLIQLGRRLRDRRLLTDVWGAEYRGEQVLPEGPAKAVKAYRDFQKKARTNLAATAVGASSFRIQALGVADGAGNSIDEAWSWWQANKMDARQHQLYRMSLSRSVAYVMVGPHPADSRRPLITPEHPDQVIMSRDPETGEADFQLKAWWDPRTRRGRANLWVAEGDATRRYRFQTTTERSRTAPLPWGHGSWDPIDVADSPFGMPIVEYPCRPELGEDPVPEFYAGRDVQGRVDMGMLNRMTAERYSAFRQKYVTGHTFPKRELTEVDSETGLTVVTGYELIGEMPFVADPASVWASEGKDTKFGEFSQVELMGYLKAHEADIRDYFLLTATPAWLYSGDLINISTDTLQALDAMHLAKVMEHCAVFGEAHEEVLAIAGRVAGSNIDFTSAEMRWRDPRQLNPAVVADMGTKKKAMGYPLDILAEDMGESPQRIKRIVAGANSQQLLSTLTPQFQQPGQPAPVPVA